MRLAARGQIDHGVVNRRIAVVVGFTHDAAVDGESTAAEMADERKTGVRANESADIEVIEKDDDEKELEKLERGDPEMIKICNIIMTQLEEFKVGKIN